MEQITIFIMGIAAGMSILGYLIISGAKRLEKRNDRDRKDTQSNEKGDSGLYPVSSEGGAESSVPGSSNNGKPLALDITQELAVYSRNVLTQYCNKPKRLQQMLPWAWRRLLFNIRTAMYVGKTHGKAVKY